MDLRATYEIPFEPVVLSEIAGQDLTPLQILDLFCIDPVHSIHEERIP